MDGKLLLSQKVNLDKSVEVKTLIQGNYIVEVSKNGEKVLLTTIVKQ